MTISMAVETFWLPEKGVMDVWLELRLPQSNRFGGALHPDLTSTLSLFGEELTSHWGCAHQGYRAKTMRFQCPEDAVPVMTQAIWEASLTLLEAVYKTNSRYKAQNRKTDFQCELETLE